MEVENNLEDTVISTLVIKIQWKRTQQIRSITHGAYETYREYEAHGTSGTN